ncbi:LysR family transcriptional regulator [Acetobacterium wieringae]|uniref:LysR family transcriptional regulator n=1 Tax=Acetobacterium wieringae TaxID=52694 RepID=A0ABY6HIH4_9FIRM|nr:LysR family transcriptional regulator [Acetobacterium wieringae]UYO64340.1 LysR family transcriptional regulator [Acetobacterium wieringae]VUZ27105.1 HTH-type transcriptional regulator BenM [Acetobacterium wieringae]
MDIKGMRYFISAAENLSFTKAALEQKVTQTAISLSISKMEEELGFQLFSRKNRSVQLTEAGRDFYEHIDYVVKKYEEAVEHGLKTSTGKSGEIRLGVPDCIMGMSLIPSFRIFQSSYPQLNLKVLIVPPHKIMQAITTREIDAAIGFPYEFESNTTLEHRIFRNDKLLVALAQNHPLAKSSDLNLEQLNAQTVTVVHPQKSPLIHQYMCNIWAKAGFAPNKVIHAATLDDAIIEVAIGNAIMLITEHSKSFCNSSLTFHNPRALDALHVEIAVAWNKNLNNPILKGLVWALVEEFQYSPELSVPKHDAI